MGGGINSRKPQAAAASASGGVIGDNKLYTARPSL